MMPFVSGRWPLRLPTRFGIRASFQCDLRAILSDRRRKNTLVAYTPSWAQLSYGKAPLVAQLNQRFPQEFAVVHDVLALDRIAEYKRDEPRP
jgi:hypothetical protein